MLLAWILVAFVAAVAVLPAVLVWRRGETLPRVVVAAALILVVLLPFGLITAFISGSDRQSADGPLPLLAAMLYVAIPLSVLCAALSWRIWLGVRNQPQRTRRNSVATGR